MSIFARFFRCHAAWPVVMVLFVGLHLSSAFAADQKILWQSREQFVAIEPLEKSTAENNKHPVDIPVENIAALLTAVDLRSEDSVAAESLFTQETVQTITPYLQQALHMAGAGDDVTFAAIGLYKSLYGLDKRPKVTTGRLFFRDNTLHLIIGLAQQEVNDRIDRRLEPFTPGSRQKVAKGDWKIVPHGGSGLFQLKRKDWIVFNDPLRKIASVTAVVSPLAAPTPSVPVSPPRQEPAETRNSVERMKVLNELKNNGLITDDEYRIKRQQILNSL